MSRRQGTGAPKQGALRAQRFEANARGPGGRLGPPCPHTAQWARRAPEGGSQRPRDRAASAARRGQLGPSDRGERVPPRRQPPTPASALGQVSPPCSSPTRGMWGRGHRGRPDPRWLQKRPSQSWPPSQPRTERRGRGKGRAGGWGLEPTCR